MGFEEKTPLFSLLQTVVKAVELGWCMTHQHDTGCIVESAVTLIQRAVCVRLSPSMGYVASFAAMAPGLCRVVARFQESPRVSLR
ncbi:hypothetical protein DVH05_006134 [Phytophthora capsici]|nr:hypothetical protein DVH05_006134 [Phytophthora capsici]